MRTPAIGPSHLGAHRCDAPGVARWVRAAPCGRTAVCPNGADARCDTQDFLSVNQMYGRKRAEQRIRAARMCMSYNVHDSCISCLTISLECVCLTMFMHLVTDAYHVSCSCSWSCVCVCVCVLSMFMFMVMLMTCLCAWSRVHVHGFISVATLSQAVSDLPLTRV